MLQISAPVQIGNSGGPVLDQFGNIIGVVVSKLPVFYAAETLKDLPQNVNFAIKAATAVSFLEANNVRPSISDSTELISPAEIAERARSFTAQVVCRPTQQAQRLPEAPPAPAPPVQKTLRLRVVQSLNLRTAPDPLSDRVILGTPPNDVIQKDAIVELRYTDLNVACRRYEATTAVRTIWCPVIYEGHGGWANALYLDTGNGRLSCLIDQTSRECNQAAQNTLWPRVVQNLTLRVAPDPRAGKVIVGPPPNDAIPIGAVVRLRYTDLKVDCRRYHVAGVVHTIWCPVNYAGREGWVNALYLDAGTGRLSCLIDPTSRDCNQGAQATLGPR